MGYGPDDTFIMECCKHMKHSGADVQQYILTNTIVCEDVPIGKKNFKKNIILDENNATRAVAESIDALDFNRYNGNVKTMLTNLMDEAAIYKYNPGNMLDWDSSSWDNNSKGLSEIFSGTQRMLRTWGSDPSKKIWQ